MISSFSTSFKKISLNTVILSFFFLLSSLIQLGFFILLTYIISQDQVALYELGRSCLEIGAGIAGPGFIALIIRESSSDVRWWQSNYKKLKILILLCSILIAAMLILSLSFFFTSFNEGLVLIIFCVSIVFQNTSSLYDALLQSREQFFLSSFINILCSFAFVGLGIFVAYWMPYAIMGIAILLWLRWIIQTVVLFICSKSFVLATSQNIDRFSQSLKKLMYAIFPLIIGTISFVLYNRIDVLMLEWMGYGETIAFYGAAFRPIGFLITLFSTFYQALAPTLAKLLKTNVEKSFWFISKCGILYGGFGIALAFLLYYFRSFIISAIYPETFAISLYAFEALLWSLPIALLGNAFGNFLIYQGRNGTVFYALISILGLIINVFGNLIAIPLYNFVGAAWITLMTDLITTILMVLAAYKVMIMAKANGASPSKNL